MPYLANELVEMIVSEFDHPRFRDRREELSTLVRLSHVSKQFYSVVVRHIYARIAISGEKAPAALVRTLTQNRYLGEHCKTLDGCQSPLTDWALNDLQSPMLYPSDQTYVFVSSRIVNHLPNLQFLDVSDAKQKNIKGRRDEQYIRPWLYLMKHVQPTIFSAAAPICPFTHLKRLDADITNMCIADLSPAFALPSISTLNFYGGDLDILHARSTSQSLASYALAWNFANPSIKRLSFKDAVPSPDHHVFFFLARACPCLVSLTFVAGKYDGFGAYLYQVIIFIFAAVIRNPEFRRLVLTDVRTTKPDRYLPVSFDVPVRKVLLRSPVEMIKVDSAVIDGLWDVQAGWVRLPRCLKRLHVVSSTRMRLTSVKGLWSRIQLLGMAEAARCHAGLEKVIVELQVQDQLKAVDLARVGRTYAVKGVALDFR